MRTVRLTIPGITYHLISRFADRRWFFQGDDERARYLTLLGRALRESDWTCISYALMSSHIHLGMVAGESRLENWAKRAHGPFATWMNLRHDRIGSVFVRGPKDHAVPPHRTAALIGYIHNNPVRANVVARANDSTWTSHRAYLGLAPKPAWLDTELGMSLGEFNDVASFEGWVDALPDDPTRQEIGGLRRRISRRGQFEFGTGVDGDVSLTPIIVRPVATVRLDPRVIVRITAGMMTMNVVDIASRSRAPRLVAARRIAVHVAIQLGVCGVDIGAALGLSNSAVTKIRYTALPPELIPLRDQVLAGIWTLSGNSTLSPGDQGI